MTHYGPDHWAALITTILLAAALVGAGLARRGEPWIGRALALLILAAQLMDPWLDWQRGVLSLQNSLPLELCDAASLAAVVALWTRHPFAFDLTYYWGLVGTMQGVLTPRVDAVLPELEYFRYWILHSGIVLAAIYLSASGMAPQKWAVWRCWGAAVALAAPVGLVDWALGANYMFLREKPEYSVLNNVGEWPWYIASMIGMLLVGFFLFYGLYWFLWWLRRVIADRITCG